MGKQGFASMLPEDVKRISSLGGKAVQAQGKGHKWTQEEARVAGKKGRLAQLDSRIVPKLFTEVIEALYRSNWQV